MQDARIVKVFADAAEQLSLQKRYQRIERYDGFILLEVSKDELTEIAQTYPVEDITGQYQIRVGTRRIDTSQPRMLPSGRTKPHPAYADVAPLKRGKHHYLVQFVGPIKKSWLNGVKRAGGEVRRPFGDFTYVVRGTVATLKEIGNRRYVRWIGHLPHRDRLVPGGRRKLPRSRFLPATYTIEFFGPDDMETGHTRIAELGCTITSTDQSACLLTVDLVGMNAKQQKEALEQISAIHGVAAIRQKTIKRPSNDVAVDIMAAGESMQPPLNLSGRTETIAVCDTGLDSGDPANMHPDFTRFAGVKSYPITPDFDRWIDNAGGDDGAADLDSGHGTHVAGSVLGSGAASAGLDAPIRGLAHRAKLYFQAVEQRMDWQDPSFDDRFGRYLLSGIPNDLTGLFLDAYDAGARIHSNSWGGGEPGEYDIQSRQLDQFVWEYPDFCVVVAAGNDGTDFDGDGVINAMSVTSPATAKNCITVGASESDRPQFNHHRYGEWWPNDYPVSPYKNAPMANSPDQVVAFSSRGPTEDGRTKPDIVAPGTFILSTRSRRIAPNNFAWGAFPGNSLYFYMGGTSMATPLVAGAVALLREFLKTWVGYRAPSAALLKACIAAGADKQARYSPKRLVKDDHQGFGRINVDAIADPQPPTVVYFMDDTEGLATGEVEEFDIEVRTATVPLRIALAYSDYPGNGLVNNLNLILRSPTRRHYVGNGAPGNVLAADAANNVEVVNIVRPAIGVWKVRVIASNVAVGPQPYALVLCGDIDA